MAITSEQVRAARALLRWEQRQLADASGISLPSIKRLETQTGELAAQERTRGAIQRALEAAGIDFIPENGGGPGVRLKKRGTHSDHPKPAGPATEVVDSMEEAISRDRARLASVKETGEEVPHEQWERFEAADKKPAK